MHWGYTVQILLAVNETVGEKVSEVGREELECGLVLRQDPWCFWLYTMFLGIKNTFINNAEYYISPKLSLDIQYRCCTTNIEYRIWFCSSFMTRVHFYLHAGIHNVGYNVYPVMFSTTTAPRLSVVCTAGSSTGLTLFKVTILMLQRSQNNSQLLSWKVQDFKRLICPFLNLMLNITTSNPGFC